MADEIFKDGENVLAVADDALEQRTQLGLPPSFAVPFRQHRCGHLDIPPQFLRRMAAQKQPVERMLPRAAGIADPREDPPAAGWAIVGLGKVAMAKSQFTGLFTPVKSTCGVSENNSSNIHRTLTAGVLVVLPGMSQCRIASVLSPRTCLRQQFSFHCRFPLRHETGRPANQSSVSQHPS